MNPSNRCNLNQLAINHSSPPNYTWGVPPDAVSVVSASGVPFQFTVEPLTNPLTVAVMVTDEDDPCNACGGEFDFSVGTEFVIVIVNC